MALAQDITGLKFGRLTVIEKMGRNKDGKALWKCRCDCGNETIVPGKYLRKGVSKSCGCLRSEIIGNKFRNVATGLHPAWKGGRNSIPSGYIKIMRKDHPRASYDGYVREHILVMEKMLGHPLPEGAVIHHCNGDRADNRPYNLRLFMSRKDHAAYHAKTRKEIKSWLKQQE